MSDNTNNVVETKDGQQVVSCLNKLSSLITKAIWSCSNESITESELKFDEIEECIIELESSLHWFRNRETD